MPDDDEGDRSSQERDLESSLRDLAGLSMAGQPLEESLTRVALLAVRAIPGADGAGLTLLESGRPDTIVTTSDFVAEVDAIQYGLGQGPCIDAAALGTTVVSGSLGGDHRWVRFGSRVARLGVHSAVSLPLLVGPEVVGALNVYARDKHVFDDRAASLGEVFAVPAAIAVQNAHVLAQAVRLAQRLGSSLEERSVVDQAVGIMLARSGGTPAEALERLRTLSQHQHTKMSALARTIVDEAVRRSRARHTEHE
ncbi:GAF and ANTAR domain-containing protein [Auraticoccus monumenti]|uniref:GAF domain-containing protein n=1 Tax=Auraticoccus monumenti TaxID=675864 RepID=A0A1G7BWS5_9ACTN|nr:GAF and ANTAR domain-containing protein [Auraticoccus monumenti]SDE31452.1 GAF domain-containing protein [Auraticoccus monumenti]